MKCAKNKSKWVMEQKVREKRMNSLERRGRKGVEGREEGKRVSEWGR